MRSSLFWDVTQQRVVCFCTAYRLQNIGKYQCYRKWCRLANNQASFGYFYSYTSLFFCCTASHILPFTSSQTTTISNYRTLATKCTCLCKIWNVFAYKTHTCSWWMEFPSMILVQNVLTFITTNNLNLLQSVSMFKSKLCTQFHFLSELLEIFLSNERTLWRIQHRHHLLSLTIFYNYCKKKSWLH